MPFDMKAVSKMTSSQMIEEIKKLSEEADAQAPAPEAPATPAEAPAAAPAPAAPEAPVAPEAPAETPAPAAPEASKELSEGKELKELKEKLQAITDKNYVLEVESQLKAFSDSGMPPAIVDKARALILSDKADQKSFKLSEKTTDGKTVTKDASMRECIMSLMEAIPLIELGEQTNGATEGDSDIDKVKKFAEENKMNFRQAYSKMLSEGKIQAFNSGVSKE